MRRLRAGGKGGRFIEIDSVVGAEAGASSAVTGGDSVEDSIGSRGRCRPPAAVIVRSSPVRNRRGVPRDCVASIHI